MSECTAPAYRAIFFDLDGTLAPHGDRRVHAHVLRSASARTSPRFGVAPEAFIGRHEGRHQEHGRPLTTAARTATRIWEGVVRARRSPMRATGRRSSTASTKLNSVRSARAWCRTRRRRARWTRSRPKGYPLVLATMPMFPRARRADGASTWAGVDSGKFARLTNVRELHEREAQALLLRREPGRVPACAGADVLMVGNNTVEDLGIRSLGRRRCSS